MNNKGKPNRKGAWFPFLLVALVIVLGLALVYVNRQWALAQIDSFEDCAQAGYPIMESYPEQCATPDGRSWTRELEPEEFCEDLCGDGECAEVVCQSIGCPCAETPTSCPADCK